MLITGASEGLGRSVAIQLAQKGANVVIASRTVQKLEAAIADIKVNYTGVREPSKEIFANWKKKKKNAATNPSEQRFHFISVDLTDPEAADRMLSETTAWNNGAVPDIVWCCAGFCHPGLFIDVPIKTLRDQMDTIYWTSAYTAHSTLRRWLKPVSPSTVTSEQRTTPRHLIFTASTLAYFAVSGYGPYAPAKAAIRNLSDVLVQEIEMYNGARRKKDTDAPATDVKIHILLPMGITTAGFENEQKLKPELTHIMEEADKPQHPDEVARVAIKGLEKGDFQIVTNAVGSLMRGSAMGASPRNNLLFDTLWSWLSSLVVPFVIPDLAKKAFKYGMEKGIRPTKDSWICVTEQREAEFGKLSLLLWTCRARDNEFLMHY